MDLPRLLSQHLRLALSALSQAAALSLAGCGGGGFGGSGAADATDTATRTIDQPTTTTKLAQSGGGVGLKWLTVETSVPEARDLIEAGASATPRVLETFSLTDENFFEPKSINLNSGATTPPTSIYRPTNIQWDLINAAGTPIRSPGGRQTQFPKQITETLAYYDYNAQALKEVQAITTLNATLTAPEVPNVPGGSPFDVVLALHFRPISGEPWLHGIDTTAAPGFVGYGEGVTEIGWKQPGGYGGNWHIGTYASSLPGLILNGRVAVDFEVDPRDQTGFGITASQLNKITYSLELDFGYTSQQ